MVFSLKRLAFVLVFVLILLVACQPEIIEVEVTRVVTETEIITETVTEEVVVEVEAVSEAEEVVIDSAEEVGVDAVEATGSERAGGQLPAPPKQNKVVAGRAQTADFDTTTDTRTEPISAAFTPLTAGEIDDNENWAAYQSYLASYQAIDVIPLDVSQRSVIVVQDEAGNPILDAELVIRANGLIVAILHTHSNGRSTFYPAAYSRQAANYEVEATANGVTTQVPLDANGTTIITLAAPPVVAAQLDLVILLDATGSMGDEIAELKANINQIVAQAAELPAQPDIRLGMVAYRDWEDDYVTNPFDLNNDLTTFVSFLDEIEAAGGGDYPEAVTVALTEAVQNLSWRDTPTVRLVFLVADAPPHVANDRAADYTRPLLAAAERGIKIYPLASSGLDAQGEYIFRQLAQFSNGRFLFLTDPAGTPTGDSSLAAAESDDYTIAALDTLILDIIREELSYLP